MASTSKNVEVAQIKVVTETTPSPIDTTTTTGTTTSSTTTTEPSTTTTTKGDETNVTGN
jgi:hypothetical protein